MTVEEVPIRAAAPTPKRFGPAALLLAALAGAGLSAGLLSYWRPPAAPGAATENQATGRKYQCPMHPSVVQDHPGDCPICGMKLVPINADGSVDDLDVTLPEVAMSVLPMVREVYRKTGFVLPWVCYIAIENGDAVGTCGFKSPPQSGRAELAYFTFPPNEGKGVATRMAGAFQRVGWRPRGDGAAARCSPRSCRP